MKKILILGGRPIGSVELVLKAKDLGLYTIVTDYLSKDMSPAKFIADESWNISTSDVSTLVRKCNENNVSYITTGVHEFNINRLIDITELLSTTCYCSRSTWKYCDNKIEFKKLCKSHNISIAQTYTLNDKIIYPVITKPVDGSGSRGFHICNNYIELEKAYKDSIKYSPSKEVLIEEYIPHNTVIIHYTMINGKCYYSGMSDKISVTFKNTGSSVMGIQTFPSKGEEKYLNTLDEQVRIMFEQSGFINGPIWIEAFYDGDSLFIFNEMGYRFGGSLTYYPVKYFYGLDQLDLFIKASLNITPKSIVYERQKNIINYCILPIHIRPGIIKEILGLELLSKLQNFYAIAPVHYKGDMIEDWGSAQQVFCYLHILFESKASLKTTIQEFLKILKVVDINNDNMLYTLFDINMI